jgi:iron(III) transport system permease protein
VSRDCAADLMVSRITGDSAVAESAPAGLPDHSLGAGRPARSMSRLFQIGLPGTAAVIGIVLVAGPFLATIIRSILYWNADDPVVSLVNFTRLLGSAQFYQAAGNSLIIGLFTTLFSCVLGFSLAWLVSRTDLPGRRWFDAGNLIPFFLSPYVGAVSWIYLMAPNSGIIQRAAFDWFGWKLNFLNIYSLGGVIFVLTLFYTPYVYLFVIGPLRHMDAALEDAARVHGASFWYTMRRITAPLLMPSLVAGAILVFVTSPGLFDVPLILASPYGIRTMPTDIYAATQYPIDFGRAAAFGVIILTTLALITILQRKFLARRRYDTITGKGYRPRIIKLGFAGRVAGLTLEFAYVGCGVILPFIAVLMVSLMPLWMGRFPLDQVTLDNYRYILLEYDLTRAAIVNSLVLAFGGATIAVLLGVLQSYYLNHTSNRYRALVDTILYFPVGIPGVILGLGFLILAIRTPLYSTMAILLIAFVAKFFPLAMRAIAAMLLAINPELEQSARASGASWLQSMRYVVVPLLKPAMIAAWLMIFVVLVRELGATILLYAQGTETISITLVVLSQVGPHHVAALAVVQIALILSVYALFRAMRLTLVP